MAHRPIHTLRVAVYSHDTYGLGHLTRSTRLARAVLEAFPDASVLLLTGSPVAHRFRFPRGLDYIKLPSVVKIGPERYEARDLGMSNRRIRGMREQLLRHAVEHFRPHLLLVDNVPGGMKGELLSTLDWLHRHRPDARVHLDLRDVLDQPEVIRRSWKDHGVPAILDRHYDEISIFGSPDIYDAREVYGLPPAKTRYMGYLAPYPDERTGNPDLPPCEAGRHRVLVTAGGGGDGADLLVCAAEMQRRLGAASPYHLHLVTGPLMDNDQQERLRDLLPALRNVSIHEFVQPLAAWMNSVDLVLSMGGYNTLCEVMTVAPRSVVVPRVAPRREQIIRARALEAFGIVHVLPLDRLTPGRLDDAFRHALAREPGRRVRNDTWLSGVDRFKSRLVQLYGTGVGRAPRRRNGAPPRPTARRESEKSPTQKVQGGEVISGRTGRRTSVGQPGPRPMPSRVDPMGAGRRYPPGPALASLWVLLLLWIGSVAGAFEWRPADMEGRLLYGRDSNLLDASDAEREAFATDAPGTFFVVDDMEDDFLAMAWEGTWTLGRGLGGKHELGLGYERTQFLRNPIKSAEAFAATYYLKPGGRSRVALEVAHRPQIYGRHRFDKDALPGAFQFRAEVHKRWDLELEMRRRHGDRVQFTLALNGSWREYAEAFRERDRVRLGVLGEVEFEIDRRLTVGSEVGVRRSRSRNEPDLGKDLSNREWLWKPFVEAGWPAAASIFTAFLELTWREYAAQDPADWNHYGRHDRFGDLALSWERALSDVLSLYSQYRTQWRSVRLDSGQDVDYDEEGAFSEHVISGGVFWSWESK